MNQRRFELPTSAQRRHKYTETCCDCGKQWKLTYVDSPFKRCHSCRLAYIKANPRKKRRSR